MNKILPLLAVGALTFSSCTSGGNKSTIDSTEQAPISATDVEYCDPFDVYSQNELPPFGAALRALPSIESEKVGSVAPNEAISVIGWLTVNEIAYPENPAPWNGTRWLLLEDQKTWVSYSGIRNQPTEMIRLESGELSQTGAEEEILASMRTKLVQLDTTYSDCEIPGAVEMFYSE